MVFHPPLVKIIQGLVHDEDGIIYYHTDQDDKAEHGQYIHGLLHQENIQKLQADEAAGPGQGDSGNQYLNGYSCP